MAITKTQQIDPAEHAPFNACTCTTTVNVGDLIVAYWEAGANTSDSQVANVTITDNVNPGPYTRLGQMFQSPVAQTNTLFYKIATVSGKPTLTGSTINSAYSGKISCTTFTGFTGTPTPDYTLGLVQAFGASGNTSADVFIGQVTGFPNSVGVCQFYINGTFFSPFPSGWSAGQSQFYAYKIAASSGTTMELSGTYSGTSTNSGAFFMETALYDFPGVGDDLNSATTQDIVAYNSNFSYAQSGTSGFVKVGSTGAQCTNGPTDMVYWNGIGFTADQQSQAVVSALGTAGHLGGVGVRISGNNGYAVWLDGTLYNIVLVHNGTLSSLIGGTQPLTTNVGDVINLSVRGNTLVFAKNGTTVKTVTDSTLTTGAPGLAFNGNTNSTTLNIWRGGSFGINLGSLQVNSLIGQVQDLVGEKLTNQSASFTEGTPTDGLGYSLGNLTATFLEGSLVDVLQLVGQTATFTEGSISASTSQNITVSFGAQTAQFVLTQLFDNISYVLDQGALVANLFGQTATFTQVNGIFEVDYFPTAYTLTSTEGVISDAPSVTLGSTAATFTEGQISANAGNNVTNQLSSQAINSSEGVIGLEADYFPTAETITSTEGVLTFSSTGDFTVQVGSVASSFIEGIIIPSTPSGTGPPLFIPPQLGKPVTTRTFSWLEMASRAWGSEFRAPDHRIYQFSGGNYKDSTDLGTTGIYSPNLGPQDNP